MSEKKNSPKGTVPAQARARGVPQRAEKTERQFPTLLKSKDDFKDKQVQGYAIVWAKHRGCANLHVLLERLGDMRGLKNRERLRQGAPVMFLHASPTLMRATKL